MKKLPKIGMNGLFVKQRRSFLRGVTKLTGAAATAFVAPLGLSAHAAEALHDSSSVKTAANHRPSAPLEAPLEVLTPPDVVVETTAGRVRGFVSTGINTFKGIPYGAVTQRFMPAQQPVPWTDVRSCFSYGPTGPQPLPNASAFVNDLASFYAPVEPGWAGEDCLRVNVWTPGLHDSGQRPVIVWLHGGGFEFESSHASVAYHGESLSRRGDVVVVSLNHRLNVLGFLNLAAYGLQFSHSANVGLLDIVLALEWVRDNIARFGGNPDNVTIMGQSGGGRKVSTLMAMPAAKGLFHKAIIHSGSLLTVSLPAETAPIAAATLAELGLSDAQVDQLQTVPVMKLVQAYFAAQKKLIAPTSTIFDAPHTLPTLDGVVLPSHPFDTSAPALSAQVPMLVGTTLNEQSPSFYAPELEAMTAVDLRAAVALDYGERADAMIAVFRRAHPGVKAIDIFSMIQSVAPRRLAAVRQIELKVKQGGASAYNFQFAWHTPVLDGRPRAVHGSDLPFAFNNIDRCVNATGGGPEARALAGKMSDAWISFARTGNPNHPGLPHWPAVTPGQLPTMIFNRLCAVRYDHDREERRLATVIPTALRQL